MKRILVTGGAGFVGHHVVEHLLRNTDWEIVILDRLSYSSNGLERLRDIEAMKKLEKGLVPISDVVPSLQWGDRVTFFAGDFTNPIVDGLAQEIGQVDYILHMGAESHVDNSIKDPEPFVRNNVLGTMHMLNFARTQKDLKAFIYFSTDEVFGPAPVGTNYQEWDRYNSGNPYAATKAGGEELALAFANTYQLPVIVTHTMNVFGERQHPEKFIPLCIRKIMAGETIQIHADKDRAKAGSRFWIHGRNVGAALLFLLTQELDLGKHHADKFNIVGEMEVDNLQMALLIGEFVGREVKYDLVDFHSSRPGHDLRYALDGEKMKRMGWELPVNFKESLERTVKWTIDNPRWLNI